MSNYVQTTFFGPKDSLPPTNPAKTIFGAAYDVEFGNIASAISSKFDAAYVAATPILFNAGTSTAPGISFSGQSGAGIYLAGSTLGFSTVGGPGAMTIDGTTGQVTIPGSASNLTPLVIGGISLAGILAVNLSNTSNTSTTRAQLSVSGFTTQGRFIALPPGTAVPLLSGGPTGGQVILDTPNALPLLFGTNQTLRGTISGAGNWTLAAATSGNTLTVTAASGSRAAQFTGAGASVAVGIASGTAFGLFIDNTASGVGTAALRIDVSATTGAQSASMTATNKPGAAAQTTPVAWIPINLDTLVRYIPAYA